MKILAIVIASLMLAGGAQAQDVHMDKARRVLEGTPLFDGHNDLPWVIRGSEDAPHDVEAYDLRNATSGHTDIARLRSGMVGAQFWSVYIPMEAVEEGAARYQLEQIDIARQVIRRYPDVFEQAYSMSDVERIFGSGKVASVLGMEGGHAIENSLGALRAYYDLGARYMTLTHSGNNDWADSGTDDPEHDGLTEFGEEVVREMNRLGMMVDLSHTSPETMNDALDVAEAPVIFSHSSAQAVTAHPRNVPDQVLRRLPDNGGVVMVTFVPAFISDAVRTFDGSGDPPRATLADVADHIEHIRDVAGIDHVGIGSDFDGISDTPIGLEDVSTFPTLLAELSRRGWSEEDLAKLAGGNIMRVWRDAESAASRIQRTRGPSTATIEELDGRSIS
jgi:membrane dipeptidase